MTRRRGELNGPPVRVCELIDYAGWLASERSAWLGSEMCNELLIGIPEWRVWPNWREDPPDYSPLALLELLEDERWASLLGKIRDALSQRLTATKRFLELPEDCGVLADRLIAAGFVEKYRRRQNHEGEPSEALS